MKTGVYFRNLPSGLSPHGIRSSFGDWNEGRAASSRIVMQQTKFSVTDRKESFAILREHESFGLVVGSTDNKTKIGLSLHCMVLLRGTDTFLISVLLQNERTYLLIRYSRVIHKINTKYLHQNWICTIKSVHKYKQIKQAR